MPHTLRGIRLAQQPDSPNSPIVYAFMLAGLVLCGLLLRPFVPALTGAVLIALVTRSPIAWLRQHIRSQAWVATIAILLVSICIVAPAVLVISSIGQRFIAAVALLQNPVVLARLRDGIASLRQLLDASAIPASTFDPASAVNSGVTFLASTVISILSGSVNAIAQIVIMLFLLFFWYRDESNFRARAERLFAVSPADRRFISRRLRDCVRATVLGRLIVAAVQGVLAWIVFLALGIPGASLLANATTVCALIPGFGAFLVWVPVVVYLLLVHSWIKAVILVLIGSLVLSSVDNILFPIIVGGRSHMNTPETFLAIFGGIAFFGIPGLVVGPLVWVMTEALVAVWFQRAAPEYEVRGAKQ